MQGDGAPRVVITNQVAISWSDGDNDRTWLPKPKQVRLVEGVDVVTIDMQDHTFRKFAFGATTWKSSPFLGLLKKARDDAVIAATSAAPMMALFAGTSDKSVWRDRRERTKKREAAESTDVALCHVKFAAVDAFPQITIKLAATPRQSDKLEVELNADSIQYIVDRCQASVCEPVRKRAAVESPQPGVYWHVCKNGFQVVANSKYKFVKVDKADDVEVAIVQAKDKAVDVYNAITDGDGDAAGCGSWSDGAIELVSTTADSEGEAAESSCKGLA